MKLKNAVVGQRVELKFNRVMLKAGATGTIVCVDGDSLSIGVQWDNFKSGHSCSYTTTTTRSGWWVDVSHIRKLKEPKTTEIVVGSRVRRNDKDNRGDITSVPVGDIGVVTEVLSDTYRIKFEQYGHACLLKHKVDLVA